MMQQQLYWVLTNELKILESEKQEISKIAFNVIFNRDRDIISLKDDIKDIINFYKEQTNNLISIIRKMKTKINYYENNIQEIYSNNKNIYSYRI